MFFPPPVNDDWVRWILGDWEGSGESNSGKDREDLGEMVRAAKAPALATP
jgi:hypothetical protein